ncbi:unnamed protein product [Rodentolepis nana]|uniref:Sushi domain-containing protein n=1 Tax=Rodentolepis nana TaxID=102285 RepID=A0A0R3TNE2_RODNA|nr:unnamed protein product [Rodentolepis nana]
MFVPFDNSEPSILKVLQYFFITLLAIRCNKTEMLAMVPKRASLAGARSTLTEAQFGLSEQNMFNQFGNVVTIMCQGAFFYPDHSYEKFIACGLKSSSETEGEWTGYGGTSLPLPLECEPVTCPYEEAFLKAQYNIEKEFQIKYENGSTMHLTSLKATPYPYKTKITYTCSEGYETVTKTQQLILICEKFGKWVPQLNPCLEKEKVMSITSSGRYVPPSVEALSATKIGITVIVIIFIFLTSIVLLDLATLRRDIGWMFTNIRLQKRLWQAKKRVREAKRKRVKNQ